MPNEPSVPSIVRRAQDTRGIFTRFLDVLLDGVVHLKRRWDWSRRVVDRLPAWVTPNGITVARMALVVPILWLIATEGYGWAFWLTVLSFIGDYVDGALASVRGQYTELGKILDPLADKVVNYGILGFLAPELPAVFLPPIWICAFIGLLLTGIRLRKMIVFRRRGQAIPASPANAPGKLKTVFEMVGIPALVLALFLRNAGWVGGTFFLWFGGLLLAASIPLAAWSFLGQRRAAS